MVNSCVGTVSGYEGVNRDNGDVNDVCGETVSGCGGKKIGSKS